MAQIYIVQGTLKCDNITYPPGAEFTSDDADLVAHLRRVGALALPAEALPAEQIAARDTEQQARIAELEAQLAQLGVQMEAGQSEAAVTDGDKSPTEATA